MADKKAAARAEAEAELLSREPDATRRQMARSIINAIDVAGYDLDRAFKWGQLVFTLGEDYYFWICALGFTKQSVGLTFHAGSLLEDPREVLVAGTGRFMRKIHYRGPGEVDAVVIRSFVQQSVQNREAFKVLCRADVKRAEKKTAQARKRESSTGS